jgi:integrase
MQRKTQRPVQFEITEATREAVAAWVARKDLRSTSFLFPGRSNGRHLSLRQYSRIVKSWSRTKPTLIYKRRKNIRAIQLLLGHTKLESTVRYLGIEVDDALEISEQTEF